VRSFPTCRLSIIAAVVLLSPIFAFLMAIAVEILIGSLMAAGVPAFLAVVVAGAIGWSLLHKLRAPHPPGPPCMLL
jgi:predicted lysophospholipase L1 biosynthesis ABC-type transport system permease subunit